MSTVGPVEVAAPYRVAEEFVAAIEMHTAHRLQSTMYTALLSTTVLVRLHAKTRPVRERCRRSDLWWCSH